MSALLELAARCEAAAGPDRELDAEIWLATEPGATRAELRYTHKATGKECVIDETRDASRRLIVVPDFTASLDAAMTLIPEGWYWMAGNRDRLTPRAYVENGRPAFEGISSRRNPERLWFEVTAATPPRSL